MTIFIPTPLRPFAGNQDAVEVNAATIAEALAASPRRIPISTSISSPAKANSAPL